MKLQEIEATKGKGGDYYGIDEVLGMDIEILEDISSNTDIREYKTKKDNLYYCIRIRHEVEKDLHLTKAALLAVASVLPKTESWMHYKIKINRTGKGFNTAYIVNVLGKGISGYQPTLPGAQVQTPQVSMDERIKKVIENLKWGQQMFPGHVMPTVNVKAACGDEETFKRLKDMGMLVLSSSVEQPGIETWRVP